MVDNVSNKNNNKLMMYLVHNFYHKHNQHMIVLELNKLMYKHLIKEHKLNIYNLWIMLII